MLFSLIIPCYNESDRFDLLASAISIFDQQWKERYEVILVNDGSQDDTLTKMQEFASQRLINGRIVVLDLKENVRKGGALKHGVEVAQGDFILTLDADMSTSPLQIIKWLAYLDGPFTNDTIYIGSRSHVDSQLDALINRKQLGGIFNTFTRWVTPLSISDTQCGFKLYPKAIAVDLFGKLIELGWAHDIELLVRAHYQRINVITMPIKWSHVDGSKINVIQDGIKMAVQSFQIGRRLKKEYN